ncbi:MAG TPA: carboxypeptidase regulatory-like domain-containing protein [Longimicrobium sp.]|nr:carboxypeptidase regulatory-like domain-containing protein [Longimicrobium sp.]
MTNRMMMRTLAAAGLAMLGLACASGGGGRAAEPVDFAVRGVVVDARTRAPIAGVSMRLMEVETGGGTAATDAAGEFLIRGRGVPGRYVLAAGRIGYGPVSRRVRIRGAGAVDVGTLAMRVEVMQLDDLIVAECLRYDRAPADTAEGTTVRAETDSTGTFWTVCRPPSN